MVDTGIGIRIASRSWVHAFCVWVTLLVTAKSANSGSRICLQAALKPKENHVSETPIGCAHAYRYHDLDSAQASSEKMLYKVLTNTCLRASS